ncbi:SMI1/KNR4 family protein [Streptomyces sp. NPDC030392]|uniref:SMI1/KNR4 family protein n=1 Tax=Streptomyces sp. NPDC030392 TaxID=3155468 RepID=UPI0033D8279D
MTVTVDIPDRIRDLCARLGDGVPYAVKVLARQLADNPRLGKRTGRLGLYAATIDGDTFDDCPPLTVRYAYGPPLTAEGQLQIRDVEATGPLPATSDADDGQAPDPRLEQITARQVTEAWQRISSWLEQNAPASHEALLPAATEQDIDAVARQLCVRVPVELRALWLLCAGNQDSPGAGIFPDHGWALMPLDSVCAVYRRQSRRQQNHDDEESWMWKPSWIPFCSWSVTDTSYGLFVDAETGEVGHWDDTAVRTVEDKSLTMLLEEIADRLENPQLSPGCKPGLIGGKLVWGPPTDESRAMLWQPFTG